ncbi:GNAT family N-acetyltransferase [Coraliomargarita akajimensis]|uniref:N-acetyltransferase domain-containing protein n=1 Tax=Coraliomargarita akajimensis (strain DSM 45221 / IAM 15411 / JCM 23193 / KCTC 12865 / 04OKA010-24) TaxID=583355 RepID=D5ELZ6_CORAD|nr:GNAT family N-acetyltransferase [Coraliomargarita akajimensis]ADE55156.1 conserved hypothetical protein [Coraliomargarita akajimensis DSM 45221]
MSSQTLVRHNSDLKRFEYPTEEAPAVLEYHLEGQVMTMHRTFVPEALRGQQVAGKLAKTAFDHAKAQGYRVIPACSYIEVYAKRHSEAAELI